MARSLQRLLTIRLESCPDISILAPNLFFSIYESGRVIWKRGPGPPTRDHWYESHVRESEYNELLRLALNVFEACSVSETSVGGPGFKSVLVSIGAGVELFMRIGRIGNEPFPKAVVDLLIEVESLIQRLQIKE